MTTTSNATHSAKAAQSLAYLWRLGLAPEQVNDRVQALRPAVEAGDGAAMLAAIDQAREWWDAYDVAQRIVDNGDDTTPDYLTHSWADLMELVARAPATSLSGVLAKASLANWTIGGRHGDAAWDGELLRTLHDGVAMLATAGGPAGAPGHE